jgi:hypothetical protein
MSKAMLGTRGPDWGDVTNLLSMLRRDLGVTTTWSVRPRIIGASLSGFVIETVVRPVGTPESIWDTYIPLVIEREWNPRLDRELAAVVWTELFLCYSYEFPSEWPTLSCAAQLPLP